MLTRQYLEERIVALEQEKQRHIANAQAQIKVDEGQIFEARFLLSEIERIEKETAAQVDSVPTEAAQE